MVKVVGAGFAGVEAAWVLAEVGFQVQLVEMRPETQTPAHKTRWFGELVCSNSFKSKLPDTPAGLLKAEMAALGSIVLATAEKHAVPGGEALCVDRDKFGEALTAKLQKHPLIDVLRREFTPEDLEDALAQGEIVILATGPLTSPGLSKWLGGATGKQNLHFYDAVSPTVVAASLNREIVFAQSRYGKGEGDDYLNCPFDKESYEAFVRELVAAERAPIHAFEAGGRRDLENLGAGLHSGTRNLSPQPLSPPEQERGATSDLGPQTLDPESTFLEKIKYFSGCTPIEAIAEKGARSLAFGNFKPVGLTDPHTGRRPWAALQLRPENREKTLYSLVACQTRLKWGEQKRVFRMVPGLENAEFVRYGVIHRNTYVEAPQVLAKNFELRSRRSLFLAGQLTGVEGYVESAAIGILVGKIVATRLCGGELPLPPRESAYGSLLSHLQDTTTPEFAPMNINWGLLPELLSECRDKGVRRSRKLEAARRAFSEWLSGFNA